MFLMVSRERLPTEVITWWGTSVFRSARDKRKGSNKKQTSSNQSPNLRNEEHVICVVDEGDDERG